MITEGTRIRYKGEVSRPSAQRKELVDGVFVALDAIDGNERGSCLAVTPEDSDPSNESEVLLILDANLEGIEVLNPKLTVADLDAALARGDHHGWGYATRRYLGTIVQRCLDEAIIEVANELELSADELFEWTDSKCGRWLVDGVYGRSDPATVETVRGYLNRTEIDRLKAEEESGEDTDLELIERLLPLTGAEIQLGLSARDAGAIADALELLAGLDDGENTDYRDLERLAGLVREAIPAGVEQ